MRTGGDCTADGSDLGEAAVDTETGGTWGTPMPVAHNLNVGGGAGVAALSCTAGGNCGAAGSFTNNIDESEAFVDNEVGHEDKLHVSVGVAPRYSGSPVGKVTVKAGSTVICTITLKSKTGTCTLAARRLKADSYTVTAAFTGNSDFLASLSAKKTLRISR